MSAVSREPLAGLGVRPDEGQCSGRHRAHVCAHRWKSVLKRLRKGEGWMAGVGTLELQNHHNWYPEPFQSIFAFMNVRLQLKADLSPSE